MDKTSFQALKINFKKTAILCTIVYELCRITYSIHTTGCQRDHDRPQPKEKDIAHHTIYSHKDGEVYEILERWMYTLYGTSYTCSSCLSVHFPSSLSRLSFAIATTDATHHHHTRQRTLWSTAT